jgi:hypothetical protein
MSLSQMLKSISNAIRPVSKSLLSVDIKNDKAKDFADIIVQAIGFNIKYEYIFIF